MFINFVYMRLVLIFICLGSFCRAQFPTVFISKQFEPKGLAIAIHPTKTQYVIAGVGYANAFYSHDGGRSWKKDSLICEAFNLIGNPVMLWDTARTGYFTDCAYPNPQVATDGSWVDRIMVNRSEDFGKSYYSCEDFGKNEKHVQLHHSLCVDVRTNYIHATWTDLDKFESAKEKDSSVIKYCRSTDGGKTWGTPKTISHFTGNCKNNDSTLLASSICSGPNGELYVSWAGPKGLTFQRSADGGNTWLKEEKIILPFKFGWHYKVSGICPARGLPTMACDGSKGENRGRIYICWSDVKNGLNNKDVFLTYSDDKGDSWKEPVLVTDYPNNKEQFMPCLRVDNSTGKVYVLYLNKQNSYDNNFTDVYLAISNTGGSKFEHYKVNSNSFTPGKKNTYGDYMGLSAANGQVRPIWLQRDGKKERNVYTAIINDSTLKLYPKSPPQIEIGESFTYAESIRIPFRVKNKLKLSAYLTKTTDGTFEKEVAVQKTYKPGNHVLVLDTKGLALPKSSYILTLYYNGQTSYTKITE